MKNFCDIFNTECRATPENLYQGHNYHFMVQYIFFQTTVLLYFLMFLLQYKYFFTIPIIQHGGARTCFYQIKKVKNHFLSLMMQEIIKNFNLTSNEKDVASSFNISETLNDLMMRKLRKLDFFNCFYYRC